MRIEDSLRPRRSREEIARLHKADQFATWFGISRTEKGTRLIEEDRYELLLAQYPPNKRSELHPSLVSFIGQTGKYLEESVPRNWWQVLMATAGAGKSSLINLLITVGALLRSYLALVALLRLRSLTASSPALRGIRQARSGSSRRQQYSYFWRCSPLPRP